MMIGEYLSGISYEYTEEGLFIYDIADHYIHLTNEQMFDLKNIVDEVIKKLTLEQGGLSEDG